MAGILITNHDTSKIFQGGNNFLKGTYTNSSGSEITLRKASMVGRVTSSGVLKMSAAASTDGSQNAIGIIADDYIIAAGATVNVTYCYAGSVLEDMIILTGAETLDTVVADNGRFRDILIRNSHIKLLKRTELTKYDNQ